MDRAQHHCLTRNSPEFGHTSVKIMELPFRPIKDHALAACMAWARLRLFLPMNARLEVMTTSLTMTGIHASDPEGTDLERNGYSLSPLPPYLGKLRREMGVEPLLGHPTHEKTARNDNPVRVWSPDARGCRKSSCRSFCTSNQAIPQFQPSKFLPRNGKRKGRVPPDAFAAPPAFTARGDHHPGICQSADGVP